MIINDGKSTTSLLFTGFGTIGILYYRLAQSTIEGRKDSAYWNSTIFGVKSSHKHH